MPTTTAHGLPSPTSTENSNGPGAFAALNAAIEANFTPKFSPATIYAYRTSTNQTAGTDLTVPLTVVLNATNGTPTNMTLNTTTGVITVGTGASGEYTASGAVNVQEVGPSRVFATIYVNGAEVLRGLDIINRGATSGDVVGSVVAGPLTLTAGDQVTLRVLHTGSPGVLPTGVFINWLQLRRIS